jgi:hypothetical protein
MLSRGIDYALRHPGVSHDELVSSALGGMGGVPSPVAAVPLDPPPDALDAWLRPVSAHKNGWLLGTLLALLGAVGLRVRAHRAFHRAKAKNFTAPWLGALVGGLMSTFFVGMGRISDEAALDLGGTAALSLTALVVFGRGIWFLVQARKRYALRHCSSCGSEMSLLSESDDDAHLEP